MRRLMALFLILALPVLGACTGGTTPPGGGNGTPGPVTETPGNGNGDGGGNGNGQAPVGGEEPGNGAEEPVAGCTPAGAAAYFAYKPGQSVVFSGEGNEYAPFTLAVLHEEGGRIEWRRDTGGTTMAEIFRVEPDRVTRVYSEGEAYDTDSRLTEDENQAHILLEGPIEVGHAWENEGVVHTIVSVDETVATGLGELDCVVVVESESNGATVRNYYHQQYGWVLSTFEQDGFTVESRLQSVGE